MRIKKLPSATTFPRTGIYRLTDRAMLVRISLQFTAAPLTIDLSELKSKEDLMSALSAVFALPDYFGRNWDALEESISELTPAGPIVLNSTSAFQELNPESFRMLLQILSDTLAHRCLILIVP